MPLRIRQSVLASEHGGRLSADLKVGLGKGKGVAQTKTDPQNNCIQNSVTGVQKIPEPLTPLLLKVALQSGRILLEFWPGLVCRRLRDNFLRTQSQDILREEDQVLPPYRGGEENCASSPGHGTGY